MEDIFNQIIKDNVDIYDYLEIPHTATPSEIRTAYRQHALIYHPDKQNGDDTKFTILLRCYEILSDETLRKKYDQLRSVKLQREIDWDKLTELTKQFQDELRASEEKAHANKKRKWKHSLEQLKEDGLKRRRILEQRLYEEKNDINTTKKTSSISDDVPLEDLIQSNFDSSNNTVRLKYSYRQSLRDLIDSQVIEEIMSIFGTIESVVVQDHDDRYGYALVRYKYDEEALDACNHNYNESASKWDGTKVRKLASLLRGCSIAVAQTDDYTNNPNVNAILKDYLARHVKSVSDKKL
ncbi:Pre-mRNA-splicing factor cwf23 [Spathaspora sp. JA1]|nr:Pre-mRNA-splicing factor cwf23 [Spathaspora sp. JA1]